MSVPRPQDTGCTTIEVMNEGQANGILSMIHGMTDVYYDEHEEVYVVGSGAIPPKWITDPDWEDPIRGTDLVRRRSVAHCPKCEVEAKIDKSETVEDPWTYSCKGCGWHWVSPTYDLSTETADSVENKQDLSCDDQ